MTCRRHILSSALLILACSVVVRGQSGKQSVTIKQKSLPTLSAQEIFKRVSPSVMVVESLDADGKVTEFGSGVVIAPDDIVTNRHVIKDGVSFRVEHNGKKWPAKLIKVDPDHDLAELSVAGLDAPAVTVLDSAKLAVGERVYAIGSPEGLELTISEGLISGLRDFDKGLVIQTSAAISPGSSGGGLFDAQGRLVGITTFYLKEGQSLNFALPTEWTIALNRQPRAASPSLSQDSKGSQALFWLEFGSKALQGEAYFAALTGFREVVRLKPENEGAWVGLGIAYSHFAMYEKAINSEGEAIRLEPSDWNAWLYLGKAYGALALFDKALRAEQEATRLNPGSKDAWYIMGLAYHGLGRQSEVIKVYEKLKTLDPQKAEEFFKAAVLP